MKIKILSIIRNERFGSSYDLKKKIGEQEFEYLIKKKYIYQGKYYPEFWRITEKGKRRAEAIQSGFFRFLAKILWRLNIKI